MKSAQSLTLASGGVPVMIVEIMGGCNFQTKLESLGIRKGITITKLTSQFGKGPITIRVGKTEVALGFGMAEKIIVKEIDEADNPGR
ncbi:MAG: FeoA family protein [bacterium]|nr:FeoA family protein [bacterium]